MNKNDIARVQLERAMILFARECDYISATTLAGAAEEILGDQLESNAKTEILDFIRIRLERHGHPFDEKAVASELNYPRNAFKHYKAKVDDTTSIAFCLRDAAIDMIERAVDNHVKLTGKWPDSDIFLEYRRCLKKEADPVGMSRQVEPNA